MIPSIFLASRILPLILFHLLLVTKPTSSVRILTATQQTDHQVTQTRTNYYYSSTYTNTYSNPLASPVRSLLKAQNDVYMMTLYIGTPPVPFSAVMDTGSNLIWTKCKTGTGLDGFFDPSMSRSFSLASINCTDLRLTFGLGESCIEKYNDGKVSVSVNLGQETLTLGNNLTFKGITFGCGQPDNDKYDGIIGMGRGDWSLISQLNVRVFSYCLGSRSKPGTSGVLLTGSKASSQKSGVQTTPLIAQEGKTYYYLSLEGISIGETRLSSVNSYFTSNGDGGMIIDSGTTFTYLEQHIIDMISNEFMNQTRLEKINGTITQYEALEHCFMYQGYNKYLAPKLVFHFEGADWELPRENYIYEKEDGQGGCLAFMATDSEDNQSIFGNMMQQNMMVIYDLDNSNLSFKPAFCDQYVEKKK